MPDSESVSKYLRQHMKFRYMYFLCMCKVTLLKGICCYLVGLGLMFILSIHLLPYFLYVSNEDFGETVLMAESLQDYL